MAHIDQFIAMMAQRHIERALLINDQAGHLWVAGQESAGPIIPRQQLQNLVQEATPPSLRPQLSQDGTVQFAHNTPHGVFQISVEHKGDHLQVSITPSKPNGAEAPQAAAAQHPAAQQAAGSLPNVTPHDHTAARVATNVSYGGGGASNGAASSPPVATKPAGTKKIEHIDDLFRMMKEVEASDVHLSSGEVPMIRLQGVMRKLDEYVVNDHEALKKILFAITPERNQQQWEESRDTDFAYDLPGIARFRCNLFADRHGIGGVFRLIPSEVLTVEQLGLPKVMTDLCMLSKGLVVVTGPTGSGKSTTLAALVDYINKNREEHIITIEDPIEFVHHNNKCLINQREVHVHTQGFKRALVAALREDPDIVLVGEMRDLETIHIAIETAETGHLVFGTLHTTTAPSTVDRIIDQFPPEEQAQIRVMLSESLKGVIAQTLLRTKDGKRVAAHEILLVPTAVANLIREGKTFQLPSQMQIGKSQGMVTMNDSIMEFVKSGRVDPKEAYLKATDKLCLLQSFEANGIDSPIAEVHHLT
jgi:twitching motility protein PilT